MNDETFWLTQKAMASLFGVGIPAISKHIKKIFDSGELVEEVVVSILEITTQHGAMIEESKNMSNTVMGKNKTLLNKLIFNYQGILGSSIRGVI